MAIFMNIFKKIKTFLRPYKWETIWSGTATGQFRIRGEKFKSNSVVCVVKYDRNKHKYASYATAGVSKYDIDINWLATHSPELCKILQKNGIVI